MDVKEYTIKDLTGLFTGYLEATKTIVNTKIQKLPQAGFGSIMLKVDLTVKTKQGSEETIYLVAKLVPPLSITKEMFNIQVTFKSEMAFYDTIVPTLKEFQKKNGIADELDMFAEFYGGRINLDQNSTDVDDDGVLLLENLIAAGFKNIEKKEGFDVDAAELILRDLARFHGTSIGLKLKEPDMFESKVKSFCTDYIFPEIKGVTDALEGILSEDPKCAPIAKAASYFPSKAVPKSTGPYATLAHGDLWVNNTMQQIESGKVVKNKFVDFQIFNIRSCSADVFFFIWTSVQRKVIEDHFDDLLKYYHKHLLETINGLNCDTTAFTYEAFLDDIKFETVYEFPHALMFAHFVKTMDIPQEAAEKQEKFPSTEEMIKRTPLIVKESLWYMTKECHKRGWIHGII